MASMQACVQKNPPAIFLIEKDLMADSSLSVYEFYEIHAWI